MSPLVADISLVFLYNYQIYDRELVSCECFVGRIYQFGI